MNIDKDKIAYIAKRHRIRDVYIFGSEVSGGKHPGSDVDIGIFFENGLPRLEERMRKYGEIFSDLQSMFADKKIDLVFLEETPLHFQYNALTDGELLYSGDLETAFDYKERIINKYRDFKYFIDEFYRGMLGVHSF